MKTKILSEPLPINELEPGTYTGSFVVGKDNQLTFEIHMVLNVKHKKYTEFLNKLKNHIDEYRGDGLIEYSSGI